MCQVCRESVHRSTHRTSTYECTCALHRQQLEDTFDINTDSDEKSKHPRLFCRRCYDVIRTRNKASEKQTIYIELKVVFDKWDVHREIACSVCAQFDKLSKGGRPKKSKSAGRPL